MTPSKAILAGSGLIAGAVVVSAALLLSEPLPVRPAAPETPATAAKPTEPEAPGAPGRYQIVKVENGSSWRLDTMTGEMTFCRVENDRMICARSSQSTEMPRSSADALKTEREQSRKRHDERSDAIFDRFMALFERILKMVEREAARTPPDAPGEQAPPGEGARPL
jgi:hypothetical protein